MSTPFRSCTIIHVLTNNFRPALAPTAYPDHASQYPNTFRIAVRLINNIDGHGFKYVLTVGRWGEGRQELAYGAEISTVGFFEDECQKLAMRSLRDEVVIQAKKEGVDVMGIA